MAIEVMNRVEKKFMVDTPVCMELLKTIEKHTTPDKYNEKQDFYTILNIYYDTDDHQLIRTSLSKPRYKEKLRLRSYGVPGEHDKVYLEMKKKFNKVVNKRRAAFVLADAYEFIDTHGLPIPEKYRNEQIVNELAFALKTYKPSPKVCISYDRRAYFGEDGLRITFDTAIRTRRCQLRLEEGDYGDPLLEEGKWLIEVKTEGALPIWLVRLFSEKHVFSNSFSKYGTEYHKFLNQGGNQRCLNPSSALQQMQLPQYNYHGEALAQQL